MTWSWSRGVSFGGDLTDDPNPTVTTNRYDPILYLGRLGVWHDDQNHVLMGQRYYLAGGYRFYTRDPIGYGGGLNLYGYCGGDPVNNADPDGLLPIDTVWDLGVVAFDAGLCIWDEVTDAPESVRAVNRAALTIDAGCLALPYIPGGGGHTLALASRGVGVAARTGEAVKVLRIGRTASLGTRVMMSAADGRGSPGPSVASGRGRTRTRQQEKGVRSLERRIEEHQTKLLQYMRDPFAFDNLGLLSKASSKTAREEIIAGRIKKLTKEIQTFQNQLVRILRGER